MALYEIKTSILKQEIKFKLQTNENYKIRKILKKKKKKKKEYTHTKPKQSKKKKKKVEKIDLVSKGKQK